MNDSTEKPLTLSIVIPVYNEEAYLKRCLDSIAKQVEMPDEVIVIDNNSADGSAKLAKSYPFVRVVTEKRQGIAYARDAGFNAVKSDLIGRIDADTILPDTWVAEVRQAFTLQPDMAFTGSGYFYDMPLKKLMRISHIYYYYYLNRLICGQYMMWGSNMAFPTKYWPMVKDNVSYDDRVAEDMDLSFLLHAVCPVVFLPRIKTSNSFRGGKNGLVAAWKYVKRWPVSLRAHSPVAAFSAWMIIISMALVFAPLVILVGLISKLVQRNAVK